VSLIAKKILLRLSALSGAAILSFGCVTTGMAADFAAGQLELNDLWVRASVPGQTNGAGYMQIVNPSATGDRLLSVQSEAATRVELHTVTTEDGVAKMREVTGIDIPAHGSTKLAPGGFHVMFLQLTAPFKQDAVIPVVLKFEKAGDVRVNFTVKPSIYNPGAQADHAAHGHDEAMKH